MDIVAQDPLVGRLVGGRYQVLSRIAQGGMATVYRARDIRLDRFVALKVMTQMFAADPGFVARFEREARNAAQLSDNHVVAVYDQGTDDTVVWLAMEYVPGRTLRDLITQRGRLPAIEAVALAEPVLMALTAAHRGKLMHRDVKPENVLLGDDGRVKVADFGLARPLEATDGATQTRGLLIGTVAYLAPEQVEHGRSDARSDVYAAGVLLFELLVGKPPFSAATPLAVAHLHVTSRVPAPSSLVPGVPPELDAVVLRATARDPQLRYVDAEAFLADLRAASARTAAIATDQGRTAVLDRALMSPPAVAQAGTSPLAVLPMTATQAVGTPAPIGLAFGTTFGTTLGTTPKSGRDGNGSEQAQRSRLESSSRRQRRRVASSPVPNGQRSGRIFLLVLLLITAAVAAGAWYLGSRTVPVPGGLVGQTGDRATSALTTAGFTVALDDPVFSETVKTGIVVATLPKQGQEIRPGGTVSLTLSKGPQRFAVPIVVGKTVAQAGAALTAAALKLGAQSTAYSPNLAKGLVLSSSPTAGTAQRVGTVVLVVVSAGPRPIPVPYLQGADLDSARTATTTAGLQLVVSDQSYSLTVAQNIVVSQNPTGGTLLPGQTISVVVSKGLPPVPVPDVVGKGIDEAKAILKIKGFKVEVNKILGGFFGIVRFQNPGAGETPVYGSRIVVSVI